MPNVKFNLKNKREKETLISLVFRYDGNRLVYSTGQKISPSLWNDKEQKARESFKFPQHPEFNAYLKTLENTTQNIYRKYKIDSKPLTVATFKRELDKSLLKNSSQNGKLELLEFIQKYIEIKEESGSPKGSIQVYKKTYKHLKGYSQKNGGLTYDDIDLNFLRKFQSYLYSTPRNLSRNYALKLLQNLKTFMNEAKDQNLHNNSQYKSRRFTIKKEDVLHIYLNQNELQLIQALNLENKKKLERVRDLFLIGAYTGLRFSDFTKLKPKHFKKIGDKNIIEIITKKTSQKVIIPIHPIVNQIIIKYEGDLPLISNQKMNDYIKEVCELAEINEPITTLRTKGGEKIETTLPKFEMVSTHTARRSFASNAYKAGVPSLAIRSITGHKTESSFLQYIKVSQEEQAVLISSHKFFS